MSTSALRSLRVLTFVFLVGAIGFFVYGLTRPEDVSPVIVLISLWGPAYLLSAWVKAERLERAIRRARRGQ